MKTKLPIGRTAGWLAAGAGLAAASYAAYAGTAYARYGRTKPRKDANALLDLFLPKYEVRERHCVRVAAPAKDTFEAACNMDLSKSAIVRGIFRAREIALGAKHPEKAAGPKGLVDLAKELGWGVLATIPGREIVMGAVTKPWEREVVFRALPPGEFVEFNEPGYVKIAWTLRAEPDGAGRSVHRTETRAVATSPDARAKFRAYWSVFSPGIALIRRIGTRLVKKAAEGGTSFGLCGSRCLGCRSATA